MGSGSLRELLVLEKIGYGGGLRDGSGCANILGTITHAKVSRVRNCRKPVQKDAIFQRQKASAHPHVHFLSAWGTRIMGWGLLCELQILKTTTFGRVYMTDPVVSTFWGPRLTSWAQESVTLHNRENKLQSYKLTGTHPGSPGARICRQLRMFWLARGTWIMGCGLLREL